MSALIIPTNKVGSNSGSASLVTGATGGGVQGSSASQLGIGGSGYNVIGSPTGSVGMGNPTDLNLMDYRYREPGATTETQDTTPVYTGPSAAVLSPLLAALSALGIARDTSRTSAQGDYGNIIKQYDDQFGIDKQRFGQQTTQNEQNLTGNRQAALLQAAQGGQGLRAVLAAMGALNGTGSILADRAIGQAANKDIGDAQNNFETNATNLTSAWADTEAEDKKRRVQADEALKSAFNTSDTNFFNSKIDILGKLANVFGAGSSRGSQYANEAAGLYDDVAKIPQGQAVSYTPVSSLYSPQALSKYLAGTNDLQVKSQSGNTQPNTPSIVATVSKRKDELS